MLMKFRDRRARGYAREKEREREREREGEDGKFCEKIVDIGAKIRIGKFLTAGDQSPLISHEI
jgi:hypothetical protein